MIAVLLLAAVAAGVVYRVFLHVPKEFREVDVARFESDTTEMLVREMIAHANASTASVYFLAFGYRLTPPSDSFLEKFSGHQPQIMSCAASRVSPAGDIVDPSSGRIGAILQIARVERITAGELEIEAALSNLPAGSNRFFYTVVQRDGRWTVSTRKP